MMHAIAQRLPKPDVADTIEGVRTDAVAPGLALHLDHGVARRVLVRVTAALVLGTFIAQFMMWSGRAMGVARFFDADVKVNFPTGFKMLTLGAVALSAWVLSRCARESHDKWARHWSRLALITMFLMLDEMAYIHQSLASALGTHHNAAGGILHYSWVFVYLPAAAFVCVTFIPFVLALRPDLRLRLIVGGVLFAGGSGGIELVKGRIINLYGETSLQFRLTTAVSDSLEMIGLAVLVLALLAEIARRVSRINVDVAAAASDRA